MRKRMRQRKLKWCDCINPLRTPLLLFFFLAAISAQAQLPDSFNGWETKSFQPIPLTHLTQFVGDDASLLEEYGYVGGERREYAKGNATLSATLWKMQDASGSFGLFTFLREPGTIPVEVPDRAAAGPDRLLLQRGVYLLDVQGAQLTAAEAELLLGNLPQSSRSRTLLPVLPDYLPKEDLVAQSPKYLLGPVAFERVEQDLPSAVIGFDMGAEAEIAQYRIGGNAVRLLLVNYPTPQMAAKKLREFKQTPPLGQDRPLYIERKGPLLCFVLDAANPTLADVLFSQVNYAISVTWNQYVPTEKDNIGKMMLNIFWLAGFILLFSFLAGLSYGGVRVLAKKFIPIPIFDRPSQVEIIQLRIENR